MAPHRSGRPIIRMRLIRTILTGAHQWTRNLGGSARITSDPQVKRPEGDFPLLMQANFRLADSVDKYPRTLIKRPRAIRGSSPRTLWGERIALLQAFRWEGAEHQRVDLVASSAPKLEYQIFILEVELRVGQRF